MNITPYHPLSPGANTPKVPLPQEPLAGGRAAAPTPQATPPGRPGVIWGGTQPGYPPAYSSTTAPASGGKNPADLQKVSSANPAPTLTRRLVAAQHPMGVRQVIGEADSHLVKLRLTAALDPDGEEGQRAKAQIRKLEVLLRRAHHKIKKLEGEQRLRRLEQQMEMARQQVQWKEQAREKAQQEARQREQVREKEQEAQLRDLQLTRRKHQLFRRLREQRYLLELTQEELTGKTCDQLSPTISS